MTKTQQTKLSTKELCDLEKGSELARRAAVLNRLVAELVPYFAMDAYDMYTSEGFEELRNKAIEIDSKWNKDSDYEGDSVVGLIS